MNKLQNRSIVELTHHLMVIDQLTKKVEPDNINIEAPDSGDIGQNLKNSHLIANWENILVSGHSFQFHNTISADMRTSH